MIGSDYDALLASVDWELLREQKLELLGVIKAIPDEGASPRTVECLEGILGLLDSIQDEAAKDLGEEAVFGKDVEECES